MKKIILFFLFPALLHAQEIPKLDKQLRRGNYDKCIKKALRYAKWHKKDKEVYYFLSTAHFGLMSEDNTINKNLFELNKSLKYLSKYYRFVDKRTSLTQNLEDNLDSISQLLGNKNLSIRLLKRLNKSYKNLFNTNILAYQLHINEQNKIEDVIALENFETQTEDEISLFGEYVPKRIDRTTLLKKAKDLIGVKYKRAGETPDGFDCSGFVMYVFKEMGVIIPHNAHKISCLGEEIELSEAKTGDLLCFGTAQRIYHIGIYYNIDGKDGVIHCISGGVKANQDKQWEYWKPKIGKVRRIVL